MSNLAVATNGEFSPTNDGFRLIAPGVTAHKVMSAVNGRNFTRDMELTNSNATLFEPSIAVAPSVP